MELSKKQQDIKDAFNKIREVLRFISTNTHKFYTEDTKERMEKVFTDTYTNMTLSELLIFTTLDIIENPSNSAPVSSEPSPLHSH